MKYIKLFAGLFILLNQSIHAQDKHIIFKASIHDIHSIKSNGYLFAMSDSTLFLSQALFDNAFVHVPDSMLQKFHYYDLEKVQLHRRNSVGRGILFGSISGLVVGAIAGFAMGDDPPDTWFRTTAGEKALALGITGAVLGTITGGIIGALAHKTFRVGRNKQKFIEMKSWMAERTTLR